MEIEPFNLSTFSFKTEDPCNVLEQIKKQKFYKELVVQNLVRFFEETHARYVPQMIITFSSNFESFRKIYSKTCWEDIGQWNCHISAPYFALEEKNHDVMFGFYHSLNRESELFENTHLHSFILSHDGILHDPHFESIIRQEEYFFDNEKIEGSHTILSLEEWCQERNKNNPQEKTDVEFLNYLYQKYKQNLQKKNEQFEKRMQAGPRVVLTDAGHYFGTKIPLSILEILFKSNPKYPESMKNLWGYLKNNIFTSSDNTDWFIEVVENNGKGFVL